MSGARAGRLALLVGEDNPYTDVPEMALHPDLKGAAGSRLALILETPPATFAAAFARVNLCAGGWDRAAAGAAADALFKEQALSGQPTILLGARVCRAFGLEFRSFSTFEAVRWLGLEGGGGEALTMRGAILPHPSGRCRIWNEPANRAMAAATVAAALLEHWPAYEERRVESLGSDLSWRGGPEEESRA